MENISEIDVNNEIEANEENSSDVDESNNNSTTEPRAVSKNQMKKRRREEYMRNKKIEKKRADKQRKLDAKLAPADESNGAFQPPKSTQRSCRNKDVREHYLSSYEKSFSIIIDCNWESIHKESALKSLANQMSYCYGANRRHSHPAKMYVTGLGPRLGERLTKMNIENWKGVTVFKEEYTELTSDFSKAKCEPPTDAAGDGADDKKQPKQLVYLTADSENLIETLDPSCAYIIGGIVDRNSAKGQTLAKAVSEGVVTARLPIRESVAISSSQVLTVNHVFEILLNFSACSNWTEAIDKVLPKRKVAVTPAAAGGEGVEADDNAAVAGDDGDGEDDAVDEDEDQEKEE